MKKVHLIKGFTLTEILVVVAIIALLSAIAAASYGRIKERSIATAWAHQLGEVETALKTYRQYELTNGWPVLSSNQGSLQSIVSGTNTNFPNFDQYISGSTILTGTFGYNYSGISYTCNTSVANFESSGVNIHIEGADPNILDIMNDIIDADNPTTGCGKFRIDSSGHAFYNIASSTYSY